MALITVKVKPFSSATKFKGKLDKNGEVVLKFDVAAPPEKGKANEELMRFLAKKLGISKNDVAIVAGTTSREKKIEIKGLGMEYILKVFEGS